jgi:acetyltransferase-like isoleucine patch superfamily enzyme
MNKLLKYIYYILIWPFDKTKNFYLRIFNFVIPNLFILWRKRIKFTDYPKFNQRTVFTGLGTIEIGDNCSFGFKLGGFHHRGSLEIQPRILKSHIKIGNRVATNNNIFLCAANLIEIGEDTLIGQYVTIMDHEPHGIAVDKRREPGVVGKVIIGKNVWIGNNVIILKNSYIGDNSIVAAGAVVSGQFPANVIIGGIPARIIKNL